MATYLSDRVIVYSGTPSVESFATAPEALLTGVRSSSLAHSASLNNADSTRRSRLQMNKFLKSLEITFRRDPTNFRPRINKLNSLLDKEQKANGTYFFSDSSL